MSVHTCAYVNMHIDAWVEKAAYKFYEVLKLSIPLSFKDQKSRAHDNLLFIHINTSFSYTTQSTIKGLWEGFTPSESLRPEETTRLT